MPEAALYRYLLLAWIGLALVTFVALLFVDAPYGRHRRRGWGPAMAARAGWMVMELPAVVVPAVLFALGQRHGDVAAWVLLGVWQVHYVYRALLYPLRLPATSKAMPLAVVAMAFVFNLINGYFNGRWLFSLGPELGPGWLRSAPFLAGIALFTAGLVIHRRADAVLLRLKQQGAGYQIPRGGLYRWVSCPNYLGELVQWIGWALATWSLAGAAFALWTAANLIPRALAHQRWYRRTFADYPPQRRAVIPYLL